MTSGSSDGSLKLDPVSYESMLFLDRVSALKFAATNVVTREKYMLPEGEWEVRTRTAT